MEKQKCHPMDCPNSTKAHKVIWEIDIDAESPLQAAKEALNIQRDSGSIATVFEVHDGNDPGHVYIVDLSDEQTPVRTRVVNQDADEATSGEEAVISHRACCVSCGMQDLIEACMAALLRDDIADDEIGDMLRSAIARATRRKA